MLFFFEDSENLFQQSGWNDNLIKRDFILPPVVQLRRPRRFMIGDMLRHFQFAAVF
jgi:hypothetical protein